MTEFITEEREKEMHKIFDFEYLKEFLEENENVETIEMFSDDNISNISKITLFDKVIKENDKLVKSPNGHKIGYLLTAFDNKHNINEYAIFDDEYLEEENEIDVLDVAAISDFESNCSNDKYKLFVDEDKEGNPILLYKSKKSDDCVCLINNSLPSKIYVC
jgi:hypothetical protein